ncbi:hypothetical protein GQ44DRAFT_697504 [Phaeosphaeriaceae sp. PMI808]|nr:hypothetical protein GQ44DRAFT_697504 [Phaeosphaeriaceae sp. PMI808]
MCAEKAKILLNISGEGNNDDGLIKNGTAVYIQHSLHSPLPIFTISQLQGPSLDLLWLKKLSPPSFISISNLAKKIETMRLWNVTSLCLFSSVAMADQMNIVTGCPVLGRCTSDGVWYTDQGNYWVNANEGCRTPGVPHMTEFCVDWGNKRGHFKFSGQGKRCFVQRRSIDAVVNLAFAAWVEAPCSW